MKKILFIFCFLLILLVGNVLVITAATKTDQLPAAGRAIFAGGCFWCMESAFEQLDGVTEVISGYTGGQKLNPTYKEVSAGGTGHAEAVEVYYDPQVISYTQLLNTFWKNIDPTDAAGQFVDRGNQYRSAVFYLDEEQQQMAEKSKLQLAQSGRFKKPLVTKIVKAGIFYPAEEYHQDYHSRNSLRYWFYTSGSGRKEFLDKVWEEDR